MPEVATDRTLDAEIAEKIFGGPQRNVQWYWWKGSTPSLGIDPPLYAGPYFTTEIAAAWRVVTEMRERGYQVEITSVFGTFYWTCTIDGHGLSAIAQSLSVEYAICEAALTICGA